MHVKKDDIPLVAYPNDELWVVFRDSAQNGVVWVQSLTADAVVEVASGTTPQASSLGGASTLTFTQVGVIQKVDVPVGGNPTHVATRIKPTAGRVAVSIAAPGELRHYMSVLRS